MRRPRAGDERSSHALGRRRGSAWWPIRAARQELADGAAVEACRCFLPERPPEMTANPVGTRGSLGSGETPDRDGARKARPGAGIPLTTVGEAEEDGRK